jgi:DNA-binding protein WhiA
VISKKKVKEEIINHLAESAKTDSKAFLYASVLAFGSLSLADKKLSLSAEIDEPMLLTAFINALKSRYGVSAALSVSQKTKKTLRQVDLASADSMRILGDLSAVNIADGVFAGVARGIADEYKGEGFKTLMQMFFVKNGVIRTPDKDGAGGYYAETVFDDGNAAEDAVALLGAYEIKAKLLERNESFAVYIKDGESVCDFLALLCADESALELFDVLTVRGERNNSNRRANCDSHNIDKSAEASVRQVIAITKIKEAGGLETVSAALRETALCRLENPVASMDELAQKLGRSKGCVQHRIGKIIGLLDERQ